MEPIEVLDDADDDECWEEWDQSWWHSESTNKSEKEEPSASSGNSKRACTSPTRQRRATSSHPEGSPEMDMASAMALWRNLLGMPDYGTSGVQAMPDQQLDVVYNFAMTTPAPDFLQLMAGWNRFIVLIMAEVNHALVRAQKEQAKNRQAWLKNDPPNDKDKKDGSEGDSKSMMQVSSGTPMFSQMAALQDSLQALSPRRRAIRAFLLLQHLRGSGHFLHGRHALCAQLRAVEELLMAQHPVQASAYEDCDVQWCREVWQGLLEAMNRILLNTESAQRLSVPKKRPRQASTL